MKMLLFLGVGLIGGCQVATPSSVQQLSKPQSTPQAVAPRLVPAQTERIVPVSQPVALQPPTPLEPPPLEPPKNYVIHERTTIVMEQAPQGGMESPPVPPLTGPTVQEGMPLQATSASPLSPTAPAPPASSQFMMWRQQMETTVLVGPPGSPSR